MALVTNAEAAAACGEPGKATDAEFISMVAGIDAYVRTWLGRDFVSAERTERTQGYGARLFLRESPITAVAEIRLDETGLFAAESIIADLTPFTWDANDPERNELFYTGGSNYFPAAPRSVQVKYTGGYTTLPEDLRRGLLRMIQVAYRQGSREVFSNVSEAGGSSFTRFEKGFDPLTRALLLNYKRHL